MKVMLRSNHAAEQDILTDDSGSFAFSGLPAGRYEIGVDAGKDFEAAEEIVDIDSSSPIATVQINLNPKKNIRKTAGMVDAKSSEVPKKARSFYESATKSADAGKIDKAIEQLKSAIGIYPDYGDAYNELGVDYLKLNQTAVAVEALQSAIKLMPENYAPHLNYGIALIRQNSFQASLEELKLSSRLNSVSPIPHLYQGRAYIGLNMYSEAENELEKSLRLGGGPEAHRFLGFIHMRRGNKKQAIDSLETYLKLAPNVGDANQVRGMIAQLRK